MRTNHAVTQLTYRESECLWDIEVAAGEKYTARFVIDASGVLANAHHPYINGTESFKGAQFHTSR